MDAAPGAGERRRRPSPGHSRTATRPGRVSFRELCIGDAPRRDRGSVIIIGGAEDKVRDRVILSRFATLAGRSRNATVVVISTASMLGVEAGERYKQVLGELGVAKVRSIDAVTRAQANDETVALALRNATGIFMTGATSSACRPRSGGPGSRTRSRPVQAREPVVAGTRCGASATSVAHDRVRGRGATPSIGWPKFAGGSRGCCRSSSTSTSSSGPPGPALPA